MFPLLHPSIGSVSSQRTYYFQAAFQDFLPVLLPFNLVVGPRFGNDRVALKARFDEASTMHVLPLRQPLQVSTGRALPVRRSPPRRADVRSEVLGAKLTTDCPLPPLLVVRDGQSVASPSPAPPEICGPADDWPQSSVSSPMTTTDRITSSLPST